MQIMVTCSHCNGTGNVQIDKVYADTLDLLKKQKSPMSAKKMSKIQGCAHTTMCMRLGRLEQWGLAKSFKECGVLWYSVEE